MTESLHQEIRIAIRFNTINVPGEPSERPRRIAEDFATLKLSRSFTFDYDFIHFHSDFYLTTARSVWMLCDFNVRGRILQVETVPIQWWNVSYDQQQVPSFTERPMNGKSFTNRLPWGGVDNEWEYRLQQRNISEGDTGKDTNRRRIIRHELMEDRSNLCGS